MSDKKYSAPLINQESATFWEGVKAGKFHIGHCRACNKNHWYPRSYCPFCFSDQTELIPASGQGKIYSYSVTRSPKDGEHIVAYVTLAEGVTMLTNIVDCPASSVAVDKPVKLVYKPSESDVPVPVFTLC